jgi:hypothetical protein
LIVLAIFLLFSRKNYPKTVFIPPKDNIIELLERKYTRSMGKKCHVQKNFEPIKFVFHEDSGKNEYSVEPNFRFSKIKEKNFIIFS